MTEYEPELGQMVFGQPWKPHAVPEIWDAALEFLDQELMRVLNNIQDRRPSPFRNTGESYECDAFHVQAYSWNEDEEQPWNFKWRDVEISWYKYLGRGMSANQELSPDRAQEMLVDCIQCLRKIEEEHCDIY